MIGLIQGIAITSYAVSRFFSLAKGYANVLVYFDKISPDSGNPINASESQTNLVDIEFSTKTEVDTEFSTKTENI